MEYPILRPVDIIPIEQNGEQSIALRDPHNIAKNVLVLQMPAFFIATMFDGEHSVADIQEAFMRRFQQIVPLKSIQAVIDRLDQELFLESETFQQAMEDLEEEFRLAPVREASHAGGAYESEPEALKQQLAGYMKEVPEIENTEKIRVLIAPHIDFHRGGVGFAHAYKRLVQQNPSDLYLLFGTAHQSQFSLITLTKKDFATPLGVMKTDKEFVEEFSQGVSLDLFQEEILHKNEHSVEFQAVWLRYILDEGWQGKIVPILCGSFHPFVIEGKSPHENNVAAQALDHLRNLIENYQGEVTIIVGADLSHVGKRFGNQQGIPPSELDRVEREDGEVLETMLSGDAEAFYRSVAKNKDRNNVCGLSPIYMALYVARAGEGNLLHYDRAIEQDNESVVTFASASYS